jgi:hypothetical protein
MSSKADKKKVKDLIHTLGLKYKMSDDEVRQIVESPFLFTYLKIRETNFNEIEEEDLEEIGTNFLYKSFGKLYLSEPLFKRRQKQKNHFKNLNDKKWKKKS